MNCVVLSSYDREREAIEFVKSQQECALCFDEKQGNKFYRLSECRHHFCHDCMYMHCDMHVKEGTIQMLK